jgi:hypothetical protein
MVRKLKLLAVAPLAIGIIGMSSFMAFATTSPATTAEIDVTVTNNDTAKDAVITPNATILDAGGNLVNGATVTQADSTTKTYKITGLTVKGDYYITLTKGNDSEKVKATVSGFSTTTPVKVAINWDDANSAKATGTKVGVLGGLAIDGTQKPEVGIAVEAYNAAGTLWSTQTDANGAYKLYLVPGAYSLVVCGNGNTTIAI